MITASAYRCMGKGQRAGGAARGGIPAKPHAAWAARRGGGALRAFAAVQQPLKSQPHPTNMQLLKERAWFDIPVVYGNSRRAILAMEKRPPGERVFADAFEAWQ